MKNNSSKIIFLIIRPIIFGTIIVCFSARSYAGTMEKWQSLSIVPDQITLLYTDEKNLKIMEKALRISFHDKRLLRSFGYGQAKTDKEKLNYRLKSKIISIIQRVQMILDMHLDKMKLDLFIFRTRKEFNWYYLHNFGFPAPSHSVYKQKQKAIYLSLSELDTGVLAHEMGHYVICTYSLIPPPANAQEILCQYLDRYIQAKKYSGLIFSE